MTEANLCTKLRADLLRLLPGAVITKHHDLSTAGVPDLSVNWCRRTTWVEVKLLKPRESRSAFRKHFDALQLANNLLLERQQTTFYFVAYPNAAELRTVIWLPWSIKRFLDDPNSEVYVWDWESAYGSYEQGVEFLAAETGR